MNDPTYSRETFLASNRPFARVVARPMARFLAIEAAGGILLLVATVIALVWANSPWSESYFDFWATEVGFKIGDFEILEPLASLGQRRWDGDLLLRRRARDQARAGRRVSSPIDGPRRSRPSPPSAAWWSRRSIYLRVQLRVARAARRMGDPDGDRHRLRRRRGRRCSGPGCPSALQGLPADAGHRRRHRRHRW